MKNIFWLLALLSVSFTGCYTSFAQRDYEEEEYGKLSTAYYDSAYVTENYDSTEYYYPNEEYYEEPSQEITIINNYSSSDWDLFPPMFLAASIYGIGYANYYDPFYDPYYYPAPYYPTYGAYWGNNYYIYGDAYFGGSYYNGFTPSPVRYRNSGNLYASIRNSGIRGIEKRERISSSNSRVVRTRNSGSNYTTVRSYDLDKDLTVSRVAVNSRAGKNGNLRTTSIRTRDNSTRVKKVSDLERRRIRTDSKSRYTTRRSIKSNDSRTQRVVKREKVNQNKSTSKRSKRVYSSRSSGKRPSSSYYKTQKKKSSGNRSAYSSSKSRRTSSYNSSRSSSGRSSSHPTYSRPSRSSSSRSNVTRPSNRSSNNSRTTSGTSSRRRR